MPPEITPLAAIDEPQGAEAEPDTTERALTTQSKTGLLVSVANALGAAWSTFLLYPDPRGRLGFEHALEDLAAAPVIEYFEVASHGFRHDGQDVVATHDGAGRLVERLFALGVGVIEFVEVPDDNDLVSLFQTVSGSRQSIDEEGGVAAALKATGTVNIHLLEKQTLIDDEEIDEPIRGEGGGLANPLDYAGQPEALAAAVIESAGNDPNEAASLVIRAYERAHLLIDPRDVREREEIVHTFVDMFFFFPEKFQAPTIAELLSRHNEEPFSTFLDQFATHEVQALAPLLDATTHPLLVEYAAIASERTDRPDELTEFLDEVRGGHPIDDVVTKRIEAILTPGTTLEESLSGGPFSRLSSQLPETSEHRDTGIAVLQGLMHTGGTEHDRRRLLRIWAAKVIDAIRHHDAAAAHGWLDAIPMDDPAYGVDGAPENGLTRAINLEVVTELVEMIHEDPASEVSRDLVRRLAAHITGHLIELLGREEDQGRRRELIEVVVEAARMGPQEVVTRLSDPRWYLVRNLALVLGRSQHPEMAGHLRQLTRHYDERVRREAIRAVYALSRDEDIEPFLHALTDPHPTVRKAAATILRSSQVEGLALELERIVLTPGEMDPKLDIITLLGALESPDAATVLERISKSGAARGLRGAARQALERKT